ncbi:MAG: ferric reductase-like transmembrane domain-containing protein [Microthrixaceae bacterium]|nr:ferric reductase-like transmembrane domain-containing protein [Microthrixaceae bacterium]
MSEQFWWAVARSGGILAWVLLAASVLWGLALSTKVLGRHPRANWLLDLHRFLGGLAVVFTGIHVLALVFDSWVEIGITQILVPFTSDYRPGAVAWGVVALYLLAAVEITSLLRKHLSRRAWKATHLASFPLFAVATLHGVLAGTDADGPLVVIMTATTAVVVGLTVLRIGQARSKRARTPVTRGRTRPPIEPRKMTNA